MAKRILDYVKYTLQELENYTKSSESCVKKINSETHIAFPPYGLSNVRETLRRIVAKKNIGFFNVKLNGIILDLRNIKILGDISHIRNDTGVIHMDIRADFYVFQPEIGATVKGIVKHISHRQIGVIIYRVFSVTIRLQDDIKYEIDINSEIEFRIKKFDLDNVMPFIEGELMPQKDSQSFVNKRISFIKDENQEEDLEYHSNSRRLKSPPPVKKRSTSSSSSSSVDEERTHSNIQTKSIKRRSSSSSSEKGENIPTTTIQKKSSQIREYKIELSSEDSEPDSDNSDVVAQAKNNEKLHCNQKKGDDESNSESDEESENVLQKNQANPSQRLKLSREKLVPNDKKKAEVNSRIELTSQMQSNPEIDEEKTDSTESSGTSNIKQEITSPQKTKVKDKLLNSRQRNQTDSTDKFPMPIELPKPIKMCFSDFEEEENEGKKSKPGTSKSKRSSNSHLKSPELFSDSDIEITNMNASTYTIPETQLSMENALTSTQNPIIQHQSPVKSQQDGERSVSSSQNSQKGFSKFGESSVVESSMLENTLQGKTSPKKKNKKRSTELLEDKTLTKTIKEESLPKSDLEFTGKKKKRKHSKNLKDSVLNVLAELGTDNLLQRQESVSSSNASKTEKVSKKKSKSKTELDGLEDSLSGILAEVKTGGTSERTESTRKGKESKKKVKETSKVNFNDLLDDISDLVDSIKQTENETVERNSIGDATLNNRFGETRNDVTSDRNPNVKSNKRKRTETETSNSSLKSVDIQLTQNDPILPSAAKKRRTKKSANLMDSISNLLDEEKTFKSASIASTSAKVSKRSSEKTEMAKHLKSPNDSGLEESADSLGSDIILPQRDVTNSMSSKFKEKFKKKKSLDSEILDLVTASAGKTTDNEVSSNESKKKKSKKKVKSFDDSISNVLAAVKTEKLNESAAEFSETESILSRSKKSKKSKKSKLFDDNISSLLAQIQNEKNAGEPGEKRRKSVSFS